VGVSAFAANGSIAVWAAVSGLAAVAFDRTGAREGEPVKLGDFNGFDAALCEAFDEVLAGRLRVSLPDLLAFARGIFEDGFFADAIDCPRAGLAGDALGDFLRVFLDIRLPFVAFGGSIIGVLRVLSRQTGIGLTAGQV
jgi:hypothetical protein